MALANHFSTHTYRRQIHHSKRQPVGLKNYKISVKCIDKYVDWIEYELQKLHKYVTDYIPYEKTECL